ncbi:alkylglycerol monooxygenase-like protein [Gorgonomyces haynaldii]|nr:alkylglycerol monooxygenase-like protein [Gorgonomyces haynaldii]
MPAVLSTLSVVAERAARLLYIVSPSKTMFESVDDVPNYIEEAIPYFVATIAMEFGFYLFSSRKGLLKHDGQHEQGKMRLNDMLTSIAAGSLQQLSKLFIAGTELVAYVYVWDHFRIYEMDPKSIGTWIAAFLAADFGYYWFHRMAHEVNLFWATHVVHHSSEYYNQSTALRQSIFQSLVSWMFYLPAALCVPPSMFLVHKQLNTLYQYWIHTEAVPRLGFLEYIINTPSAHRVHHGRNPYCIDKNYAGTLIIWDRLFGTYQDEKVYPQVVATKEDEEPVAYGLVHPINTFDPITVQTHHFSYVFKTAYNTPGFINKFKVLFYGPGWHPGTDRLGDPSELPPISPTHPPVKYDPIIPLDMNLYCAVHGLSLVHLVNFTLTSTMPLGHLQAFSGFIASSFFTLGSFFDAKPQAIEYELLRVSAASAIAFSGVLPAEFRSLDAFKYIYGASSIFVIYKWATAGRYWTKPQ